MDFPKWKYHKTQPAVIVHSESEESSLGSGWGDTPRKDATEEATAATAPIVPTHVSIDSREAFAKWLADRDLSGEDPHVLNLFFDAYTAKDRLITGGPVELYVAERPEAGPDDTSEEARVALLEKAKGMGITLHHMTGIPKIQAAIDAKLAEDRE